MKMIGCFMYILVALYILGGILTIFIIASSGNAAKLLPQTLMSFGLLAATLFVIKAYYKSKYKKLYEDQVEELERNRRLGNY